jgi:hypothetical protein
MRLAGRSIGGECLGRFGFICVPSASRGRAVERAGDPLHRAAINAKALGNATYTFTSAASAHPHSSAQRIGLQSQRATGHDGTIAFHSINAHSRGLDRRCPFLDFALDEASEILRRRLIVRHDLGAKTFEPITHCGGMHRLQCGIM